MKDQIHALLSHNTFLTQFKAFYVHAAKECMEIKEVLDL